MVKMNEHPRQPEHTATKPAINSPIPHFLIPHSPYYSNQLFFPNPQWLKYPQKLVLIINSKD